MCSSRGLRDMAYKWQVCKNNSFLTIDLNIYTDPLYVPGACSYCVKFREMARALFSESRVVSVARADREVVR
jgi:hypothetical protein